MLLEKPNIIRNIDILKFYSKYLLSKGFIIGVSIYLPKMTTLEDSPCMAYLYIHTHTELKNICK